MSRPRKRRGGTWLTLLILIIAILGAGVWFISPTQKLDLGYRAVDFKPKLLQMVETREAQMILTPEEVGNLSKKNLIQYLREHDLGVEITGAAFRMDGDTMLADINGRWGLLPFGALLQFHMTADGSFIYLKHEATTIRGVDVPTSWFHLSDIQVSLKEHLPDLVTVRDVEFLQDGMKLSFKLDWTSLPLLLK
ncbi:hypothetical protein ABDI30_23300 [Paenibacillus cisolokensis]|uniref:hypothetical protein n=1 Tax=Paenibacillus cisolokensis TaxID=1658519 RepID=UPI003D27FEF7